MMRAPMSRMDILTETEIHEINSKSKLVRKYSEIVDRESAYEMLNKKIAVVEEEVAKREEEKQAEKEAKSEPSTTSVVGKSVLKVLTSATFIRGAFSILSKIMRK
jgi:hypothetical protein